MHGDDFLDRKLYERISGNFLRSLVVREGLTDFCSNDYLGISTNYLLQPYFSGEEKHGSRGARTLAGNYRLMEETEQLIGDFHQSEAALIFNSGYAANTGLIQAVAQRGDVILYDSLAHASIRDGVRLSFAASYSFSHNDMDDLEQKIKTLHPTFPNQLFVVTESVFSMDGDKAPIENLVSLCEKYGAHLIVDEAHAIGVIGENGEGLVQSAGLNKKVFARVYTYGKAPGAHGAAVCGSQKLKSYLINFARSFIYTTALPESAVRAIQAGYQVFPDMKQERQHLHSLIRTFQESELAFEKLQSETAVQGVIVPGNGEVKSLASKLLDNGLDVRPILYPSVPKGKERLRISLHAFNTFEELDKLIALLK